MLPIDSKFADRLNVNAVMCTSRLLSDMKTIAADWQGKPPPVGEKVKSRKLSREENIVPPVVYNPRAAFPTAAQVLHLP